MARADDRKIAARHASCLRIGSAALRRIRSESYAFLQQRLERLGEDDLATLRAHCGVGRARRDDCEEARRRYFRALLISRNYRLYAAGQGPTHWHMDADGGARLLVLQLTGSEPRSGLVIAAQFIPVLLLAPLVAC